MVENVYHMRNLKQNYVGIMNGLGRLAPSVWRSKEQIIDAGFGWKRWFASLFAIYNTDRMIALDLPWWNVQASREIDRFLAQRPGARVFEYGAGASTVWLAKRAAAVTSVEHDVSWLDTMAGHTAGFDNIAVLGRSIEKRPSLYVNAIDETDGLFDLIVIDGRQRSECLARATSRLGRDGIILFDDSGRQRYRSGIENSGLIERRYRGLSYCVPYPDSTSILRNAVD